MKSSINKLFIFTNIILATVYLASCSNPDTLPSGTAPSRITDEVATAGAEIENPAIRQYTTGQDVFSGWDWIINRSNIALGIANEGNLRDFQHKIHFFDENVDIFQGGEFFCDPDNIIFIPTTGEVAYLPYLPWEKDIIVNNENTFGRLSFIYKPTDSTKEDLLGVAPLSTKIGIRIDNTIQAENSFIDARVYLTNQEDRAIDIVYIAQDAAYMYLPDGDQRQVQPLFQSGDRQITDTYSFEPLKIGDIVATDHATREFVGGYIARTEGDVWGGIVPEYAFFQKHKHSDLILGFADVTRTSFTSVEDLNAHLQKSVEQEQITRYTLKNRILVFSFRNVPPGETVVAQFYQFGAKDREDLDRQLAELNE